MIKSFFERIFSFRIQEMWIATPFINLEISSLGEYQGINKETSRETPIVISLASNRENFKELPLTLYSLLNQNLKPDRIILWLDKDCEDITYLPYEITQFIKNGLEIKFVKNIGNYTKTIYALEEFPNAIIVTAEDYIYYSSNWLQKLYISYIANPCDIHVHKALAANLNNPFNKWEKSSLKTARYENFMLGDNGILYPPNCFSKEALRKDIFLKHASNADSIWFWIMALVQNKKIRIVKNNLKTTLYTNFLKHIKFNLEQKKNMNKSHDEAMQALLKLYGRNIYNRLEK